MEEGPEGKGGGNRGLLALLLAITPFGQIPLDIYTPAMPVMVGELHTDATTVQNTVTFYILGMSLALIPVGMIADAIGRKKTLLIFMGVLIAASIACALAPRIDVLIAFRFVQGIGGCSCAIVAYSVAADKFRGRELTSVSGLLGIAWGLAPVLAPALGGFLVQYTTWRMVFAIYAVMAAAVYLLVIFFLRESLAAEHRSPIHFGKAARVIGMALRDMRFMCFTLTFALFAGAQLVFGVVAPFLYQNLLGFSAAAYGLMALALGGANLCGEIACTTLAMRITPKQLCFGAWVSFFIGAVILAVTGTFQGPTFWAITVGCAILLLGCGTLCPTMYGMALGVFSRNLGLLGGFISTVCYLTISGLMALAAYLPESSQGPMGWMDIGIGVAAFFLLAICLSQKNKTVSLSH